MSDIIPLTDLQLEQLKYEIRVYSSFKSFARCLNVPYNTLVPLLNGYIPMRRSRLEQIKSALEEAKADFHLMGKRIKDTDKFPWHGVDFSETNDTDTEAGAVK